jgi:hypothetical protein
VFEVDGQHLPFKMKFITSGVNENNSKGISKNEGFDAVNKNKN